jgi:phosphopantothenoylcysteine synthetase/decarboxylase
MSPPGGVAKVLCVVVCGAGPAAEVGTLVRLAHAEGWEVRVVATPTGSEMIDKMALEKLSGAPVRVHFQFAGSPRLRSSAVATAVVVAPATYNTINKLALGVNDTYALNVVAESIGRGAPVSILPFINSALAARRPFDRAVQTLRDEGVRVIYGPGQWMPHPPGTGGEHLASFPWRAALSAVTPQ